MELLSSPVWTDGTGCNGPNALEISVVIPTYNSAWSIERTLVSVLAQRFSGFEVIIVDDGSTDDLHQRIEPFLRDVRVRLIVEENRGLAGARNRGIAEARCQFVAMIDADDIWHPDFLGDTLAALKADPVAPFAYAYSFRIDRHDRVIEFTTRRHAPRHDFLGLLALNSVSNGSAALFRKTALLAAGAFDETLAKRAAQGAEDWKLALKLAASNTPALVERNLVGYRLVANSMSQQDPRRQLAAILAVIDDIRESFPNVPAQHYANSRTMMIAWLLPALLNRRMFGTAARQALIAYALNPLWMLNGDIRRLHIHRLKQAVKAVLQKLTGGQQAPPPLKSITIDGEQPFSDLPWPEVPS